MSKKVVFLDVDGELTYSEYKNEDTANIDIEKVKLLKEICDRTGAKVVISSSWRGNGVYIPRIYYILINILRENGINVIGNTPYIESEIIGKIEKDKAYSLSELHKFKRKYGTGRAAEVQRYIQDNQVDKFVILDDEDFNWVDYGYDKYWIRPTWFGNGGLKREHVEDAIRILNM